MKDILAEIVAKKKEIVNDARREMPLTEIWILSLLHGNVVIRGQGLI